MNKHAEVDDLLNIFMNKRDWSHCGKVLRIVYHSWAILNNNGGSEAQRSVDNIW